MQAVWLVSFWYLPSGHGMVSFRAGRLQKAPMWHSKHVPDPAPVYLPMAHAVQFCEPLLSVLRSPAGHVLHAAALPSENVPGVHNAHVEEPGAAAVPAAHGVQDAEPDDAEMVPPAQSLHDVNGAALILPGSQALHASCDVTVL